MGNFSSKIISLLLLPLFTLYLTQEEYGLFDILNTIVLFLVPIAGAQIFEGIIRYLLDTDEIIERKKIISTSFYFLLFSIVLVVVIIFGINKIYPIPFVKWLSLYFIFYIVNFYLQRTARGLQQQKHFAISGVINTVIIGAVSVILLVVYNFKTDGLLIAYSAGAFSSMLYLLVGINFKNYLSISTFSTGLLKKLLFYSVPLLFDAVIWWTMNLSDRLILGYFEGVDDVGVYGVANRFAALLTFLNHIFYLVWQEYAIIKSRSSKNKAEFSNIFFQYLRVQFTGVILLLPAVKLFVNYFIEIDFQSSYLYIPALLFSAMFSSFAAFYGLFYQIDENTKGALYTSLIAGILNIVLNFIFIPIYGIWAAALTTLTSFMLLWIIRVFQFRDSITFSKNILIYSISVIGIVSISLVVYYQNILLLDYINLLTAAIFFFIINKELITKFIKTS